MTIEMTQLVFNPVKGYDESVPFATLDYDPKSYTNQRDAAFGLYDALCRVSRAHGQNPDIEVAIQSAHESQNNGFGHNWRVIWESGPFEWAIALSFQVTGPWGFTEPYYSFDLCFTH